MAMEDKLVDNMIAKRKAQEAATPIRQRINKATGRVPIFLISEQKVKEVFPVDAREMIEMGLATFDPVEMVGKSGRVKVALDTVQEYMNKGYKLAEKIEDEPATGGGDKVSFEKYSDEDIQKFAKQAGIPGNVKKRETIIAKLEEMKFDPNAKTFKVGDKVSFESKIEGEGTFEGVIEEIAENGDVSIKIEGEDELTVVEVERLTLVKE